ncbi:MAG: cytochrome-c oxidase, cbb3-type subunit III [Xanthomonadaceae bacterium]|jgi:cytochrome c oxidase cbb3-type subunit 3|nr:cytochrome-c oxidase, cbb3-type subunit III [Xanthomonadaceae bacterium]
MTAAWSWYVIALVVINIVGCVWLLRANSKSRPGDPPPDATGHVWDANLTEYNKPLPMWWIMMFYITIVFSIGYLAWYGLGTFGGLSQGWTSQSEWAEAQRESDAKLAVTFAPYAGKPIDELAKDPTAVALGRSIFANNCSQCHGSSGQGAIGYPNLTDAYWQWGGTPDDILVTILDGRQAAMVPWGETLTSMGGESAVDDVVTFVRSLSNPKLLENSTLAAQASKGKSLYGQTCVACHMEDGKGNTLLGSVDLTSNTWLYGGSPEVIKYTIVHGRTGQMPGWSGMIGETRSRVVGAYVWSLSRHDDQTASAVSEADSSTQ